MSPTPTNNKIGKDRRDQKGDRRKVNDQIKRVQDEKRKLEKEKQDYERQKSEEVSKINDVKKQLDAGASQLQEVYEKLLEEQTASNQKAANLEKMLQETKNEEIELQGMEWVNEDQAKGDDEDLFTLEEMMREMGVSDDETVIGWRSIGRGSEQYLVQYGPQNAANFMLKRPSTVMAGINKDTASDIGDHDNRYGEMKVNKSYVYQTRHFKAIQGVAWVQDGNEDPTSVLRPKEKGEERRYPTAYVRIKWEVDGASMKSWEVRATVQRIFGSNKSVGDKAIYLAAKQQLKRHQEWAGGKREGKEASPTPDPEIEKLKPVGKTAFQLFKEEWCEALDLDSEKLDDVTKEKCFDAFVKSRAPLTSYM